MEPASGYVPPWCPHAVQPRMGTSLLTQQQQHGLQAGGAAPQKLGRRCPPPGHHRPCPLQTSPVHPEESQWGQQHGQGGQGTLGTPLGHPEAPQRHGGARLQSQGKDRGEPWGHIRAAWVWWQSMCPVLGEGQDTRGSISGVRRRMGVPRDAPQAHHCCWEKDGGPWGCTPSPSLLLGERCGILGMHLQGWEWDRTSWGYTQSTSPLLGEGWRILGVHLWSWEWDRAPQACIQSPSCHGEKDRALQQCSSVARRMWHPGDVPRAHHWHWERDRASWGCISAAGRRTGHPWDTSLGLGKGWGIQGGTQSPSSPLGAGQSTPGVHLQGQGKGRAPWGSIAEVGRRIGHPRDALRAHQHHQEKDGAPWGCISETGKRTRHPREAPRAHRHLREKDGAP